MTGLTEIDKLTRDYSTSHLALSAELVSLDEETAAVRRRHMPAIRRLVEKTTNMRASLVTAIKAAPALFERPRTLILHGMRVGYMKSKGGLHFDDPDQVVKLIKKHIPDQADMLIKVVEKPLKDALAQLSAAELKKIGVEIDDAGDQVVVKSADSEIDKLVKKLLADAAAADAGEGAS